MSDTFMGVGLAAATLLGLIFMLEYYKRSMNNEYEEHQKYVDNQQSEHNDEQA